MSYGIKAVSKTRPCPICGKTDWCGFMPLDEGGEMVVCMRDTEHTNVIGHDGAFYVYVRQSKTNDNSIFEEAVQRQARQDAWKIQKGYSTSSSGTDMQFKKASTFSAPKMKVIDEILPKSHQELDKIYRYLLSILVLDDVHRDYLHKEGWSDELIEKHQICSFPERDFSRFKYKNSFSKNKYRKTLGNMIIEKFGKDSLTGVPGAYLDKNENWTFAGRKGLLFPLYDAEGYIYRLRIRMDYMDENRELQKEGNISFYEEGGVKHYLTPMKGFYTLENGEKVYEKANGKYRNLSSYKEDEEAAKQNIIKNKYNKGCESGNQLGIYYNSQRDNMFICYVTEGEKKGIYSNDKLRAPFISQPGVNSWGKLLEGEVGHRPIDILKKRGVKMFVIAYDADKAVNEKVLNCETKVIEALKKEGFAIGIANWNALYGKGIDDLLAGCHLPTYEAV